MLKRLALGIFGLTIVLLGLVLLQPSEFRIKRTIRIEAPPHVPFGYVNDFRKWALWSPWEPKDGSLERSFSGPADGVGAKYRWKGKDRAGAGSMTIVDTEPARTVDIELELSSPFSTTNETIFTFTPEGAQTQVVWTMSGENDFRAKAFSLFLGADEIAEADFDRGLVALKSLSEKPTR